MCVVAAKYLDDIGWVGMKNRDRNYKPEISLIQSFEDGIERLLLKDEMTGYTEGINEYGISILSSATLVKDDENEIREIRKKKKGTKKQRIADGEYVSKDGKKLRTALLEKTIDKVIKKLQELAPLGNHLVFNEDKCYMVEIDITVAERKDKIEKRLDDPEYENPEPDVDVKVKEIKKGDIVVRTNHGIYLNQAGYQDDEDKIINQNEDQEFIEWMKLNRESSEIRYSTVEKSMNKANTVDDMLSSISDRSNKNPQFNPLRTAKKTDKKSLRTTGQIIIIPSKKKLSYRNIWSKLNDTTEKVNNNNTKTYIDILCYEDDIYENTYVSVKFDALYEKIMDNY